MAQQNQNVCIFNKYGYCKFKNTCRKQHIQEKCSNEKCEILKCSFRHPKICRYFRDFRNCKFGEWCSFRHEIKVNKDIEDMKKALDAKIETYETKLKTLETCLAEKNLNISQLEEKLKNLETKIEKTLKLHGDKINDLDNKLKSFGNKN